MAEEPKYQICLTEAELLALKKVLEQEPIEDGELESLFVMIVVNEDFITLDP